jgi:predicted nucleic acid-binding Zn ribbon protein
MRRNNGQSLQQVIAELAESTGMRERLDEQAIRAFWADLAGAMIGRHTVQLRLKRQRLAIKVDSAPLRHELTYQREGLARLINERLGREVVQEVVVE